LWIISPLHIFAVFDGYSLHIVVNIMPHRIVHVYNLKSNKQSRLSNL